MLGFNKKKSFDTICRNNRLDMDYVANKHQFAVLNSIFVQREYALCFPFYEDVTVVDIGAHFGYFSLFAALNTSEKSRVYSFEPSAGNFKMFSANIRRAGFQEKIFGHQAAIAAQAGELTLHLSSDINHSLFSDYALMSGETRTEKVTALTLADVLEHHSGSKIDFLKIDCEGAEYDLVFSADRSIWKEISTIAMEFHDLRKPECTGNAMVKFLVQQGYSIIDFHYDPSNRGLNYGKIVASRLFK